MLPLDKADINDYRLAFDLKSYVLQAILICTDQAALENVAAVDHQHFVEEMFDEPSDKLNLFLG